MSTKPKQRKRGKGSGAIVTPLAVITSPAPQPVTCYNIKPHITMLPSVSALVLVPVLVIRWDINPITFPHLFDPEVQGSLYHIMTPGTLNTINAAAQGHPGLIPILLVHDMAHDPSLIVRSFTSPVIYM